MVRGRLRAAAAVAAAAFLAACGPSSPRWFSPTSPPGRASLEAPEPASNHNVAGAKANPNALATGLAYLRASNNFTRASQLIEGFRQATGCELVVGTRSYPQTAAARRDDERHWRDYVDQAKAEFFPDVVAFGHATAPVPAVFAVPSEPNGDVEPTEISVVVVVVCVPEEPPA